MARTTNDKLNLLRQTKEAFRAAITGKGQTISNNEPFSAWPAKIAAISSGGQLPTLTNPGKAADLAKGKELLDGNGNIVTGTALIPGGSIVFPDGAFAPVTEFTDGKQYALVALINGTCRYINTTTYNNYTMNATAVTIQEDAGDYVIFSATPALFTAVASGNGFLLKNGNNYLHGTTTSGTALRVGTTQAVWTADASETGGFASGKYHAKEDPNAVWLKNNNGGYDWSIKYESAGAFGYDRSGRDNTYSTGFVSFVLYEYVAGEGSISPIVDTSDATATAGDMGQGATAYVKGEKVEGTAIVIGEGKRADLASSDTTADVNNGELRLNRVVNNNVLLKPGGQVRMAYPLSGLGDAQPSDVAAGKTFTSAAGFLAVGTGGGGGGIGGKRVLTSVGLSDIQALTVSGLSPADYAYLLDCQMLLVFADEAGTNTSRRYLLGGLFSIGSGVSDNDNSPYNRAWFIRNSSASMVNNPASAVTVTQESDGIRVAITLASNYFGAGAFVTIAGLKY